MATHNHHENQALNGNGADCDAAVAKKPKLTLPEITDSEIQSEFSHHDPAVSRINNGSFGSCPQSVISAQRRWQSEFLRQPDDFYFNRLKPGIIRSRSAVKSLINQALCMNLVKVLYQ